MVLSPDAQRVASAYPELSVAELNQVQQVHVRDYYRFKAEGSASSMKRALIAVNAFGEYIDSLDGTTRL